MRGYVIQNEEGHFLTRDLLWYPHDRPSEAYVHPEGELGATLRKSRGWTGKPTKLYPAVHYEGKTAITGNPISLSW